MPQSHPNDRLSEANHRVIDVIVPVHNACDAVIRCLESVIAHQQGCHFELIVIDDASSDAATIRYLNGLAASQCITLFRNELNIGFVGTVNRGMRLHPDRDVVLLNSDTEVANNWLDKLTAAASGKPDIGTVTPFSNNATICSFPIFCVENFLPKGMTTAALDRIFAAVNGGKIINLPTAVGFCMYIRRACLAAVGIFDESSFGRGYGEENDFCRRAMRMGWRNVLCADTFVYHAGSASFKSDRIELSTHGERVLLALHPDYQNDVRCFIRQDPVAPYRRYVEIELARIHTKQSHQFVQSRMQTHNTLDTNVFRKDPPAKLTSQREGRIVQLHVLHDLGGGVERWCHDFQRADQTRINLILKPFCRGHAAGEGLWLFEGIGDTEPIAFWLFAAPFEVTAVSHPEYRSAITELIATYQIDCVLVSSLIGHTLDILQTGLPTIFIAHDFFPVCPAINLYFDGVCDHCDDARIVDCLKNNPDFNPFMQYSAADRISVRKELIHLLGDGTVPVVVSSRVVWRHLENLFPCISGAPWACIPHGVDDTLTSIVQPTGDDKERLRIVVLGALSVAKGMHVLDAALDRLTMFADVHLVGAREVGQIFASRPNVHVVTSYSLAELQTVIQEIQPHVGLLLSVVPETFSYTLTELMRLGVPPIATNIGSFAERIIDGDTGYLIAPDADTLVEKLTQLNVDRGQLTTIQENLATLPRRSALEMVADYHQLIQVKVTPARDYITPHPAPDAGHSSGAVVIHQGVALRAMWKQIKSLDLQLAMAREANPRPQSRLAIEQQQLRMAERQRDVAEHQRAIAEHQRTIAEHQRALSEQQRVLAEEQTRELARRFDDRQQSLTNALQEQERSLNELSAQLASKDQYLHEVFASTSWRISRPVRVLGSLHLIRRIRFVFECFQPALSEPLTLPITIGRLLKEWRSGGVQELRRALHELHPETEYQSRWTSYCQRMDPEFKSKVVQTIEGLRERPLISIIVPTYNTKKAMLRQMIESVQAQLYRHWELCIADDCSTMPHVRRMLNRYAKDDDRIKIHLSTENRGVSYTSNQALKMATGQFVVLLDHDDILEGHAVFRVAQSLLGESPDMVYSDEIMVSEDLREVLQYAFRPAFSPELLRGHPYIVHMVGFRTQLLRDIGGFDEALKISQDYDLILRATERAATVTHIPDFLYRWRIHGGSAGKQRKEAVMHTSKEVLRRHLQRCGKAGDIDAGLGFNLFDARYPLQASLRVAIIIPTKNHGDLLRQCVESLRSTIHGADFDLVIVNHESTEPATLDYLSSIADHATVLRYFGPFNFSAINNWAVSKLSGVFTHYLFCNNDIEATGDGWLERMLELGQHQDTGIVGAQLLYPDRTTIQHAGVCVGAFGAAEHFAKFMRKPDIPHYLGFSEILRSTHEVSAVTAACLLIRRDVFREVSGFDEKLAVGFGDVDLCLRVGQKGYRILQCPHAELLHHESFTRGKTTGIDPHPEDSALFQSRWAAFLHAGDPYFHPGLYQNSTAWQMRNPMQCGFEIRRRVFHRTDESGKQSFSWSQ